jgi:hypothetical protein
MGKIISQNFLPFFGTLEHLFLSFRIYAYTPTLMLKNDLMLLIVIVAMPTTTAIYGTYCRYHNFNRHVRIDA